MSKHVEIAVTTHGSPASSLSNPSRSAASIAPFAADQLSSPKRASRCQLNDTQGYPQTIHSNRVFHDFHHPFWSTPIFGNIKTSLFVAFFLVKTKLRTICHLSQGYRQVLFLQITNGSRHLRFQQSKELQGARKRSPHLLKTRLILAIMWDFFPLRTLEFAASRWYMLYKFTKNMIGK